MAELHLLASDYPCVPLKLHMFHGRHAPDEEMDDWGFDGPTLEGVEWFHVTYMVDFRVKFVSLEAMEAAMAKTGWEVGDELMLYVKHQNDLLKTTENGKECYYGDWSLFS